MSTSKIDQVRDFVAYHKGAFSVASIAEATGLGTAFIRIRLWEMRKQGLIRVITKSGKTLVYSKVKVVSGERKVVEQYDWVADKTKLLQILGVMEAQKTYSGAEISRMSGIPVRTLYRYLETLAYMRCIAMDCSKGWHGIYYRTGDVLREVPAYSEAKGSITRIINQGLNRPQMDTNEKSQMNTNDLRESGEWKAESGEKKTGFRVKPGMTGRKNAKR